MEVLVQKKNVVFDATTFSAFQGCPRFFDIRFSHRLVSMHGKSNSLEVGSLIHKVLEVYYKHLKDGFPRATAIGNAMIAGQLYVTGCPHCADKTDLPEGVTKLPCGHEPQEYPGMHATPEHNEKYDIGWRFALQTCEQYFDFYKNDSLIVLDVECVDGKILYEDDEIRVGWKAKLDLKVDTNQIGIISCDHKTFKQDRQKTTLNNQFIGQCLVMGSRNVLVNKIGLQTSYKIEDRLSRELVPFSADRLEEWRDEVLPYYAYKWLQFKESEYWPPNWTHCDNIYGSCPYKDVCQADRIMREDVLRNGFRLAPVWDPRRRGED